MGILCQFLPSPPAAHPCAQTTKMSMEMRRGKTEDATKRCHCVLSVTHPLLPDWQPKLMELGLHQCHGGVSLIDSQNYYD